MIWNALGLIQAVMAFVLLVLVVREPGGVGRPFLAIWLAWAATSIGNAVGADSALLLGAYVISAVCLSIATYIEWHASETARANPTIPEQESQR